MIQNRGEDDMKKFKNNKSLIIGLASALGVASLATAAGVTASQMVKTNSADADKPAPFQAVSHHTVQFIKPSDTAYDDLHYQGRTTLDVKHGYPFGIIAAPTPVYAGFVFDHWVFGPGATHEGDTIEKSTPITEDCSIVPVMVAEQSDIEITGDHDLYDGLYQAKTYTLTSGTPIVASDIEWEAVEEDLTTESTAVTVTPITGTATCSVIARDTLTAQTCYLKATYGTGATQKVVTFKLNVYPPYYYVGTEEIASVTYNYGECFWVHIAGGMAGGYWLAITEDSACSQTADLVGIRHTESEVGTVSEISRDSSDIAHWAHIFPGCEINVIGDNFMAATDAFNAQLHGGVNSITKEPKVLSSVGHNFLQDCVSFDQDISALFTLGADYSITLGDCFMDGCTGFTNGGEDFVLPTAAMYGDYFMNGCSSLTGEITFGSQVIQVGDYFMNDTGISAVTIPSSFGADMESDGIGAFFLTDCENLDHVTILTDDVTYFKELSMPAQDRASFVRFTPYDEGEHITLLCPNASEQFLDGFAELDGTDGYYRHFVLDTETLIASWDYMKGMYDSPFEQRTGEQFTGRSAADEAYFTAVQENPQLLLADMLTKEESMHSGSTIDNVTITITNFDPNTQLATYRVQMKQTRDMAGMLSITQVCDLEFANVRLGIFDFGYDGEHNCFLGSSHIYDQNGTSGSWNTILDNLQNDSNWTIKGNATLIVEPYSPMFEEYAINKTWTGLNLDSTNFASSDFITLDHDLFAHPYGMFSLMGVRSDYLYNCTFMEK